MRRYPSLLAYLVVVVALAMPLAPARAVAPDEILRDARLETRARALSAELRCLVCQNQSIDDSEAPLARDLRLIVRERLRAGDSDRQILDFVVARYSEFVLLRPRLSAKTLVLWFAPVLLLALAALYLMRTMRRPALAAQPQPPLSAAEQRALDVLLGHPDEKR